jgi:hypothetical protein
MNTPEETRTEPDSGYPRLETQIRWYDAKSGYAQKCFKWVKGAEFIISAVVPVAAFFNPWLTAILGVLVVVLEGLQQLNQWQHNWITYRSTCEALRHEKYSYLGGSGSYDGLDETEAKKALVERIESLISAEHSKWISKQEYELTKIAKKPKAKGSRTSNPEHRDG